MKIQHFWLIAAFGLASMGAAFAQDSTGRHSDKTKYLFNGKLHGKINHLGVYFAPEIQYGGLAGGFTPMAGGSAMLLINRKLGIGITGYSTFDRYTPTVLSSSKSLQLNSQFGGLKLEYTANPNSVVHVTFSLMGGVGNARIDSANRGSNFNRNRNDRDNFDGFGRNGGRGHGFAVIQPGVQLEANLFRFAKLFAGVSYRITSGGSATYQATPTSSAVAMLSNSDLMGLNFSLGMKVGVFDYPMRGKKHKKEK